jgi:hypothetical protein
MITVGAILVMGWLVYVVVKTPPGPAAGDAASGARLRRDAPDK